MKKLLYTNADGSMNISVESQVHKVIQKSHTWYTHKFSSFIGLIIFSFIDILGFYQIAELTITQDPIYRIIIISAFAVAFDIAPLYIGYAICMKCYDLGKSIHNWVLAFSTIACLLGVITNIIYRAQTMEIAYNADSTDSALPLTIALCVLPIITSLINLVIGCLAFDPLLFDLARTSKKLRILKTKKRQIMSTIDSLSDDNIKMSYLVDYERKCYNHTRAEISALELRLKNYITAKTSSAYDE